MKNLPPIFKVSNNISSNNTSYYKSSSVAKMPVIKHKEEEEQASIEDKINAIFRTRGCIITLDNEVIPIATITSFQIKKAHQS